MSRFKKMPFVLLIVFIAIQFIQPTLSKRSELLAADIAQVVDVSDSVQVVLRNACYDCHSNDTNYPWYSKIQPIRWLMNKHIKQGKAELNFSEFGSYSLRRQLSKLTGIANSVRDNSMPLSSYKWTHKIARLTKEEKLLIIDWVQQSKNILLK